MPGASLRLLLAAGLAAPLLALSQAYPSKPLRIVTGYPVGGPSDLVSRVLQPRLSAGFGQPVIVENRVGASGTIGAGLVAHAPPDGYTLLFTTPGSHTQVQFVMKNVPYDPVRDFTAVTAVVRTGGGVVFANPALPVASYPELVDYARRNPGKLSFATSGVGSAFHLIGEIIKQSAGIDMVHVPYKGGVPALQALISGEVPLAIMSDSSVAAIMKSGKIRPLVVAAQQRLRDWPDIPAIVEFQSDFRKPSEWLGFFAPAGLPQPLLERVYAEVVKASNHPEVRPKLEAMGMEIWNNRPEEFASLVKSDIELGRQLAATVGIKPE